jgi:hypothetical protein
MSNYLRTLAGRSFGAATGAAAAGQTDDAASAIHPRGLSRFETPGASAFAAPVANRLDRGALDAHAGMSDDASLMADPHGDGARAAYLAGPGADFGRADVPMSLPPIEAGALDSLRTEDITAAVSVTPVSDRSTDHTVDRLADAAFGERDESLHESVFIPLAAARAGITGASRTRETSMMTSIAATPAGTAIATDANAETNADVRAGTDASANARAAHVAAAVSVAFAQAADSAAAASHVRAPSVSLSDSSSDPLSAESGRSLIRPSVAARPRTRNAALAATSRSDAGGIDAIASEPQSQAPVIHVTIGRVEVRASIAPPAAKARSSTPASMSLGEYLGARTRSER